MRNLRKFGQWYFLGLVALAAIFIWSQIFLVEARRGRLFLRVFDVGQGDAVFIEAVSGNQVLVDGGPDNAILTKLSEVLPWWDRSLDLLILTHPHADHLDGLIEVLRRYDVGMVLESGVNHSIAEYALWHRELAARRIPVFIARRGQIVRLGDNAAITILAPLRSFAGESPKNIHDATIVAQLSFASSTALLMGDAETALERELIRQGVVLPIEVLKVGHHGSKTSTSDELLRASQPRFAVISAGRKNRYGHPTQEVLDRLQHFGIATYRTDQDGDILFMSDGRTFVRR